jgi:hypothetical protein
VAARSGHFAGAVPVVEVEQQCKPFVEVYYLRVLERPRRLSALMDIPERILSRRCRDISQGRWGTGIQLFVEGWTTSVERPSHSSLSVYLAKSAKEREVVVEVWRYLPSAKHMPAQSHRPTLIHLASRLHPLPVGGMTARE